MAAPYYAPIFALLATGAIAQDGRVIGCKLFAECRQSQACNLYPEGSRPAFEVLRIPDEEGHNATFVLDRSLILRLGTSQGGTTHSWTSQEGINTLTFYTDPQSVEAARFAWFLIHPPTDETGPDPAIVTTRFGFCTEGPF